MFDPKVSQSESASELPVLPLRNLVLLPGITMPIEVGRKSSLRMLETVVKNHPPTLLVTVQLDPQTEDPQAADLHPIAVQAEVLKVVRTGPDKVTAVLKGERRRRFEIVHTEPYLIARALPAAEQNPDSVETLQAAAEAGKLAEKAAQLATDAGQAALAPAAAAAGGDGGFLSLFTVFVLACFVGYQVVWSVSPALHTPLMSVTNAISGIIIIGGMLQISGAPTSAATLLGAAAILLAMINVAGGFLVTQRMLKMFRK